MSAGATELGVGAAAQRAAAERAPHRAARGWPGWTREPLLHFVVLGAALFAAWPFLAERVAPPSNQIVVSQGELKRAVEIFTKTHARPPSPQELADLVEQDVQTEVYFREGMALGLDRDDEIIRRRIAQKVKFMVQDVADQAPPSDAELQAFLTAHPDQFGAEPQIAFSQVYLNPDRHGAALDADAARLLARLNNADGRLNYGTDSDVLPVPNDFEATPLRGIANMFGDNFAAAIQDQPAGRWVGPVRSGYGVHLVLVRQKLAGAPPQLAKVRDAVLREVQSARRTQANVDAYRQMRAKYTVRVETNAEVPAR